MFQPFLEWLYTQVRGYLGHQYPGVLEALPQVVELPDAPFSMVGYRRQGRT